MKPVFLLLIRAYKYFISPLLPPNCRFYPSCSDYAHGAVAAHGAVKGAYYGARRLLKCHPYHPGGYDPVPDVSINADVTIKESSI